MGIGEGLVLWLFSSSKQKRSTRTKRFFLIKPHECAYASTINLSKICITFNHVILSLFPGFRGDHCEENIDDCPGNLCQNGATCIDRINEYSCLCPPSYTGTQCELDVDECSVRPSLCHNGATCTNSPGSYSCICVNGWTGPDCSVNIDDCAGAACFNGATCIDRVGSFYCQCTYGKTGESNDSLTRDFLEYLSPDPKNEAMGSKFYRDRNGGAKI